jgi:hypothetical protein
MQRRRFEATSSAHPRRKAFETRQNLIFNSEWFPGRTTIVLVQNGSGAERLEREPVGF